MKFVPPHGREFSKLVEFNTEQIKQYGMNLKFADWVADMGSVLSEPVSFAFYQYAIHIDPLKHTNLYRRLRRNYIQCRDYDKNEDVYGYNEIHMLWWASKHE